MAAPCAVVVVTSAGDALVMAEIENALDDTSDGSDSLADESPTAETL
jgi:hypothetical protein